jgi:hypothetical protein
VSDDVARRASRLLRLYPRQWRQQFPDFEDVLAEELREHPQGVYRNVMRAAARERLREFGILPKTPADRARSGLALIYAAIVPFVGLAMGMRSQLRTSLGSHRVTTSPILSASVLFLTIGTLLVLLALPVAVVLIAGDAHRSRKRIIRSGSAPYQQLIRPALVFVGAFGVSTVAGWVADRSGWYSPAAVALPHSGPGHVATLWVRGIVATITPAWIHPTLFAHMPPGEVLAALIAPIAVLTMAGALFRLIVGLPLRAPGRANIVLAAGAFTMMFLSAIAAGRWILNHPSPQGATPLLARTDQLAPGHTGWGVVLVLVLLTFTALVGLRRILRRGGRDFIYDGVRVTRDRPQAETGGSPTDGTLLVA